jgi:Transposase IS116/IS110/IS902 family
VDTVIADLLEHHDGYHAIQALPGIGPVLAAVIVAEIGDIRRFSGPARLSSWAGLTPRHRESGLKVSRGHITKQGSPILRWAVVEAIQHQPPGSPSVTSKTASSPAAAKMPATSPRPQRPATCSPASSTQCVTGRPDPWPPAPPPRPRREQAPSAAARDRLQVWPPPPGGAAAPLIDPAARTRNAPCTRGPVPREPRRDDRSRAPARTEAAAGAHHNHMTPFPAREASQAAGPASRSFVQPGAPPLTLVPLPACLETSRKPGGKGHNQPLDRPHSFRDDLRCRLVAGELADLRTLFGRHARTLPTPDAQALATLSNGR